MAGGRLALLSNNRTTEGSNVDPNAALARMRELADGEAVAAAEIALDLDEWLSRGGFAPDAWMLTRVRSVYHCDRCSEECYTDGSYPSDSLPCPDVLSGRHAVDVRWHHENAHDAATVDPECRYCAEESNRALRDALDKVRSTEDFGTAGHLDADYADAYEHAEALRAALDLALARWPHHHI